MRRVRRHVARHDLRRGFLSVTGSGHRAVRVTASSLFYALEAAGHVSGGESSAPRASDSRGGLGAGPERPSESPRRSCAADGKALRVRNAWGGRGALEGGSPAISAEVSSA